MSTRRTVHHVRQARTGLVISICVAFCAAVISPVVALGAPKPPNPSDQQIQRAQAQKSAAATRVGTLAARIAVAQTQLLRIDNLAQVAEQKLAYALQRQRDAEAAAVTAKADVIAAQARIDDARRQFNAYVQQIYMSGDLSGTTGALLTAEDPSSLLQRSAFQQYATAHQLDAIGQLTKATVGKSNADAAARAAVQSQARATHAARAAQDEVIAALNTATAKKATLDNQMAADNRQLEVAQIALTGLTDQRAAYRAWKKQQDEIAAREAARKRAQQLAQQRAAAAAAARLRSGGGGGGGGGASSPTPSGGSWTPAKGQQAVSRAMRYRGWPYSWAAGNASGPTYGVSEPGAAWNDSNILGFDCSGLTLYAWAPRLSMDHYAATQYTQAGSYHPSTDNLMPGDLVFWSGDGSIAGIGHEAMYIGGGNVIQAPQSGDIIKITNIFNVESGYFGATRPLT